MYGTFKKTLDKFDSSLITPCLNFINELIPAPMPPRELISKTKIIAHRGSPNSTYDENTMAGFEHSFALGLDGIEFDIHLTSDEKVVITHDKTLLRTYGINLDVTTATEEEIRNVAPEIPFLNDVISKFIDKHLIFAIELKNETSPDRDKKLLQLISECLTHNCITDRVIILSFNLNRLKMLKSINPEITTILISRLSPQEDIKSVKEENLDGLFGHFAILRNKFIKKYLHNTKLHSGVGIVNSVNLAKRLISHEIDYIFTDQGEKVTKALSRNTQT
jgi:glycerophosphoryl diester phosphodiesterase